MRLGLGALLLGLACAPLHAQPMEKKKTEEKKKTPPFKAESSRTERDRDRHREHKPPPASAREQRGPMNQQAQPPKDKRFSAHPSETRPKPTAPSQAEQMQRQIEEQRRIEQQRQSEQQRRMEQGKSGGTQQAVFQCSARPVCGGGGYGRCSGVEQTYRGGTEESRRRDMVDDCIQANTPDTCQCAVQCRRVARCSKF